MLWDWLNARRIVCGDGAWILLKPAILPWKSGYWFENDSKISFLTTRRYAYESSNSLEMRFRCIRTFDFPIVETAILYEDKLWQKLANFNTVATIERRDSNGHFHELLYILRLCLFFPGSPLVRNVLLNFPTRRRDASRTRCLASGQFLHEMSDDVTPYQSKRNAIVTTPCFFIRRRELCE